MIRPRATRSRKRATESPTACGNGVSAIGPTRRANDAASTSPGNGSSTWSNSMLPADSGAAAVMAVTTSSMSTLVPARLCTAAPWAPARAAATNARAASGAYWNWLRPPNGIR